MYGVFASKQFKVSVVCIMKEDIMAPPPENDDVVNDFDIEEEVIEVENRLVFITGCN